MKVGNVVRLNSGSPKLTITMLYENYEDSVTHQKREMAEVVWIEDGKEQKTNLPVICLTPTP